MTSYLSPVGTIVWGNLIEPGENRASGELQWDLGLVCNEEECQPFFAAIEDVLAEVRNRDLKFPRDNSGLILPFSPAMKKNEAGELEPNEGFITLKAKRKRMVKRRGSSERIANTPPRIYDSEGKLVVVSDIPRGSKGKAVYDLFAYNTAGARGVSMGLQGFQIVELAEQQGSSLPPVEGGWRAETELDHLLQAGA